MLQLSNITLKSSSSRKILKKNIFSPRVVYDEMPFLMLNFIILCLYKTISTNIGQIYSNVHINDLTNYLKKSQYNESTLDMLDDARERKRPIRKKSEKFALKKTVGSFAFNIQYISISCVICLFIFALFASCM